MKTINLKREWNFITSQTCKKKLILNNSFKKELFFILQTLLTEYEGEKNRKKKLGRKEIYQLTKNFYLQ